MKDFILFFNRKYPLFITPMLNIVFISIGISLIIIIIEPFGFYNYEGNKTVASIGFGISTLISLIFDNFIIKKYMFKITRKWTIYKEILYLVFVLSSISIVNFIYFIIIVNGSNFSINGFFYSLFLTISIGFSPIVIVILLRYNNILKNRLGLLINNKDDKINIVFSSSNKTEKDFSILLVNFLFVEAIKNHIYISYFDKDEMIKTKKLRNTLINITSKISNDSVFRCHRSFLVNLNNIKTIRGNSNGYKIYFRKYNHYIPVSRSYAREFQKIIY